MREASSSTHDNPHALPTKHAVLNTCSSDRLACFDSSADNSQILQAPSKPRLRRRAPQTQPTLRADFVEPVNPANPLHLAAQLRHGDPKWQAPARRTWHGTSWRSRRRRKYIVASRRARVRFPHTKAVSSPTKGRQCTRQSVQCGQQLNKQRRITEHVWQIISNEEDPEGPGRGDGVHESKLHDRPGLDAGMSFHHVEMHHGDCERQRHPARQCQTRGLSMTPPHALARTGTNCCLLAAVLSRHSRRCIHSRR